jgi:hypothetical protein
MLDEAIRIKRMVLLDSQIFGEAVKEPGVGKVVLVLRQKSAGEAAVFLEDLPVSFVEFDLIFDDTRANVFLFGTHLGFEGHFEIFLVGEK